MNNYSSNKPLLTRRELLSLFGTMVAATVPMLLLPGRALASPKDAKKRLAELTGNGELEKGRVTITLPAITSQMEFVPIRVLVDSPMTETDYVKALHICSERNPEPAIASCYFTPDSGKAEVSTRVRLLQSQVVIAAAEMSDGSFYYGKAFIKISTGSGGCG